MLLIAALPSMGWAQADTSPAYPQANLASDAPLATTLVPRDAPASAWEVPEPIYARWEFWTVAVAVTGVVAGLVVFAITKLSPLLPATSVCNAAGCNSCIGLGCR